jgi:uncharacterized CHY-type Zn-finger protein
MSDCTIEECIYSNKEDWNYNIHKTVCPSYELCFRCYDFYVKKKELLNHLKEKHNIIICSNCQEEFTDSTFEEHQNDDKCSNKTLLIEKLKEDNENLLSQIYLNEEKINSYKLEHKICDVKEMIRAGKTFTEIQTIFNYKNFTITNELINFITTRCILLFKNENLNKLNKQFKFINSMNILKNFIRLRNIKQNELLEILKLPQILLFEFKKILKNSKKLLFPDKLRNRPGLSCATMTRIENLSRIIRNGNQIKNYNYKVVILKDLNSLTPSLIQKAFMKAFDCIYQFKSKIFEDCDKFIICSEIIRIFLQNKDIIYLLELPELDSILIHPNLPILFIQLADLKENLTVNSYINCL